MTTLLSFPNVSKYVIASYLSESKQPLVSEHSYMTSLPLQLGKRNATTKTSRRMKQP